MWGQRAWGGAPCVLSVVGCSHAAPADCSVAGVFGIIYGKGAALGRRCQRREQCEAYQQRVQPERCCEGRTRE